ncbi:hypothetical protein PGT21_033093 [Puccinia graminis f. sp. tritici]|uniref:Secreted protein n=1 Tax=Puccinia graminis f. sp. tritici TaxID=56615 RepID=A0A5B0S5W6_PUCGR|nr:hypothetical protein PGT21_033093 [Puccinia graminis f. sp. tritici]KAA1133188.1 hypothetical protein PGTUg99_025007 [Puccinia graminis f. sp. tritici]
MTFSYMVLLMAMLTYSRICLYAYQACEGMCGCPGHPGMDTCPSPCCGCVGSEVGLGRVRWRGTKLHHHSTNSIPPAGEVARCWLHCANRSMVQGPCGTAFPLHNTVKLGSRLT